jgi:hypothetical protein
MYSTGKLISKLVPSTDSVADQSILKPGQDHQDDVIVFISESIAIRAMSQASRISHPDITIIRLV